MSVFAVQKHSTGAPDAELPIDSARRVSRDGRVRRLLLTGDALALAVAVITAFVLAGRGGVLPRTLWALPLVLMTVVLFKLYGLYDRDVKRMSHSTVDDLPWLFHALMSATLLAWLYARNTPMHRLSFAEVALFAGFSMTLVTSARILVRSLSARWMTPEPAVLVGGGEMAALLVSKLRAHPEYSARVIGQLVPETALSTPAVSRVPRLGTLSELEQVVESHGIRRIVLSPTDMAEGELEGLLGRCRSRSLKVTVLPQLSDVLGPAVEVDDVEGVTVLGVNPPWLPRSSRAVKRALDLVLAGSLLIVTAPLMLAIALAVKLGSPGPVLFRQTRVGRGGRRFRVIKFRTMVADAEARRAGLLGQSMDPHWLHLANDPRITRVGRFLRLTSLDELPQLLNVMRGEMSMVGPRPLIEEEDRLIKDWGRERLDLTPGITGYWQVLGRTRIPFEEMVRLDYLYVMNWSLWGDIRLILKTVPAVLFRRGAN